MAENSTFERDAFGKAKNWSVTVEVDGEPVLCISSQHLAGASDLEPYEATIKDCAEHLLSFIGARQTVEPAQPILSADLRQLLVDAKKAAGVVGNREDALDDEDQTNAYSVISRIDSLLAQRQDTQPVSIPTETGIYAWLNEYSAALVMVNKRPSDCSPGGILNGHVMESTKFYDGCQVEYWTGGKWFGPLTAQPAQRQDHIGGVNEMVPQLPDSGKDGKSIAEAVTYWNSKWPAELHSGVMFFKGQRITKEEFLNAAKEGKP